MSVETSYQRYKRVLEEIADGADNAQELATEALRPRGGEPTYEWKTKLEAQHQRAETRRKERSKYCKALYLDWLKAGRPAISKYARNIGKSYTSTGAALYKGERLLKPPHEERWLANATNERQLKLAETRRKQYEERLKQDKVHWIRVRYFDREESAEALATELGWTAEQMQAFIEAARMDRWVTTTEYNAKMLERWKGGL